MEEITNVEIESSYNVVKNLFKQYLTQYPQIKICCEPDERLIFLNFADKIYQTNEHTKITFNDIFIVLFVLYYNIFTTEDLKLEFRRFWLHTTNFTLAETLYRKLPKRVVYEFVGEIFQAQIDNSDARSTRSADTHQTDTETRVMFPPGFRLGGKKTKRLRAYRRLCKKTRRHRSDKRARKNKNNK